MRSPYPATQPRLVESIDVGDGHNIYVEEGGNPAGIPVVFLHGGPGSGCKPGHRQFFNPDKYRSVLLDQRGSGRSAPYGGVEANSTPHLAADLETVRQRLGIDRWLLFGGSWGAYRTAFWAGHVGRSLSQGVATERPVGSRLGVRRPGRRWRRRL